MPSDVLRTLTLNLDHDGGPPGPNGELPESFYLAQELIAASRPDVVARQEMTWSQTRESAWESVRAAADHRFGEAQRILGMTGYRAPKGHGNNPTAMFVRRESFATVEQQPHFLHWRTPPTVVRLTLPEAPDAAITAVSVHMACHSIDVRRVETDNLTTLVDKLKLHQEPGPAAGLVVMGDMNGYPTPEGESTPPVEWSTVEDRAHRHHRATQRPDGTWESCTYTDRTLRNTGMADAARWAAHHLGQPAALAPTAGHGKPGQGGPARIDRTYINENDADCILDVTVLDTSGFTDHHAVVVTLSRRKLVENLRRRAPYTPVELAG